MSQTKKFIQSNKVFKVIHIMLGMSIMLLFTFDAQVLAMGHAVIIHQEQYYCVTGDSPLVPGGCPVDEPECHLSDGGICMT